MLKEKDQPSYYDANGDEHGIDGEDPLDCSLDAKHWKKYSTKNALDRNLAKPKNAVGDMPSLNGPDPLDYNLEATNHKNEDRINMQKRGLASTTYNDAIRDLARCQRTRSSTSQLPS